MSFLFKNLKKEQEQDPVRKIGHYIFEILNDSPDIDNKWQFKDNTVPEFMDKAPDTMDKEEIAGVI